MDAKSIIEKIRSFLKENTINHSTYWYPLSEIKSGIPVSAYLITEIYSDNRIDFIESVLKRCNIRFGYWIQEYIEELHNGDLIEMLYEKDEDGYVFPWLSEMFIFDRSEKWLIYISHEETIAFTGEELVKAAREIIPEKYEIQGSYNCLTNEQMAAALIKRLGFDFDTIPKGEIKDLLKREIENFHEGSSEYIRLLCGYLFCLGDAENAELIEMAKYGINMDVGCMIDYEWVESLKNGGVQSEYIRSRDELIEDFVRYYSNFETSDE